MRFAAIFLLALAGCSGQSDAQRGEPIACALGGATEFARSCRMERQGTEILLVHPDGGFRRLGEVDGRLVTADGSQRAEVLARAGEEVEVAIGTDRYRFVPTGLAR